jgi:hypothetical protein
MDATLEQIAQAISVIHNPNSTSEYRSKAQLVIESQLIFKFVDEFKLKSPNVGSYALELLNNDKDDIFRHFGLHLLQFIVDNQWNTLDSAQKENFFITLLNYCSKVKKTRI